MGGGCTKKKKAFLFVLVLEGGGCTKKKKAFLLVLTHTHTHTHQEEDAPNGFHSVHRGGCLR
jgi:hypothetical protein